MDQRLSLVTLGVADLGRARTFYEQLGWRGQEVEETVFFQAGSIGVVLWGRTKLAEDAGVEDTTPGGFGGIALAHNVHSPSEVDAVVAAAAEAGATITRRPDETFYGGYAGCFVDPDGHVWEIAYNPGFGLDEDGTLTIPDFGTEPFVPVDFSPPTQLDHPAFRLRPLDPEHNERDHAAWTGSIDHIRATPGYPDGRWPRPMTLEQNLADLQRHHDHFRDRIGFTYTVLEAAGPIDHADVIGCVYIYPDDQPTTDVHVQSWVREDHADLDAVLASTVRAWLEETWPWRPHQIRDHPRDIPS